MARGTSHPCYGCDAMEEGILTAIVSAAHMRNGPMAPWRSVSTFGDSILFSFRQAVNAVKSKLPSSMWEVSLKASANQPRQEFSPCACSREHSAMLRINARHSFEV